MSEFQLSEREREILQLVATGATNQQIAQQLSISPNTVKVHLRNIFAKLGVESRTEATLYAVRTGLVHIARPSDITPPTDPADTFAVADLLVAPEFEGPALCPEPLPTAAVQAELDSATRTTNGPLQVTTTSERIIDPLRNDEAETSERPGDVKRASSVRIAVIVFLVALLALVLVLVGAFGVAPLIATRTRATPQPTMSGATIPQPDERWHLLAAMPSGRANFALSTYSYDGRLYLYVIGGEADAVNSEVFRYDIELNQWVVLSSKPTPVADAQAIVIGNRLYVPGGRLANGTISDRFEVYDPQRDRWSSLNPLPAPRSAYALAAVEGKLYLFGGWDGGAFQRQVWQYDPDQDRWNERTPMPTARAFAGMARIEGQIYVMGGENASGPLATNERYTPADENSGSNPWITRTPLPQPWSRVTATAMGGSGIAFVIGGTMPTTQLLLYRSNLDSWESNALPSEGSLYDQRMIAVDNRLFLIGGRNQQQVSARAFAYQALYTVVLPIGQ